VPLRDISDVNMGTFRISSFCQIKLSSGEEDLTVASDIENFPEFVSLLCERVNESRNLSRVSRAMD
jgi:hypothetical protein